MADTVLNAQVLMAFKTVGTARSLREIGQIESALKRTPDNKTITINTPGVNQATRVLSVMTDTLTALQAAGAKVARSDIFSTAFGMAGMDSKAFDKYVKADTTPTVTYSKDKGVGGVINAQSVSLLNEYADRLRDLGASDRMIKSLMTDLGNMANFLTTDTKSARALETALLDTAGIKSEFQREAKTVSEISKAQKQVGADATTANSLWQKGVTQINRSYDDITRKIAQVDAYLASGNYTKAANGVKSVQTQITNAARAAEDMQQRIMGHTVGTTNAAVISGATAAANDIGTKSAKNVAFFNEEVNRLNIALDALSARLAKTKAEEDEAAAAARRASEALKQQRAEANSAANNFFRFRAILALVVSAFYMLTRTVKSWFEMSSEFAETNHLLYATLFSTQKKLGQVVSEQEHMATGAGRAVKGVDLFGRTISSATESVDEYGNVIEHGTFLTDAAATEIENIVSELDNLADALQVDPTNLKKTYATFYEMANSAGMASDKIHEVSVGMTRLTYDIGSLWDEDFESVAKKMRSALGGITTSVRMFGVDISRSAADSYLMEHGIDATYNSLNRANKMLVLYNMIIRGTTTDQNDLAKSASQPANLLRILGEQAQLAARMLGAALFPIVTPLIVLFYQLMKSIQAAAQALSSFFSSIFGGWYDAASKGWNSFLSNLGMGAASSEDDIDDLASGLEDVAGGAGGAADAAKELRKQLMGFDEINNITPETDTGGGGGGGGGGGVDADIGIWENIEKLIINVKQQIMDFAENAVPYLLKVISEFADGFLEGFMSGFTVLPALFSIIATFINDMLVLLRDLFGTMTDGSGTTVYVIDWIIEGLGRLLGTIVGLSAGFWVFGKIASLASSILSPISMVVKSFHTIFGVISILGAPMTILLTVFALLAAGFVYLYNTSEPFRKSVSDLIAVLGPLAEGLGTMLTEVIGHVATAFSDMVAAIPQSAIDGFMQLLQGLILIIQFLSTIIIDVLGIIISVVGEGLAWLFEAIGSFFSWLGGESETSSSEVGVDAENMKASAIGAFEGMSVESIPIIGGFLSTIDGFFESAAATLGGIMQSIGSAVASGWSYVSGLVDSAFNALSSTFGLVFDIMTLPFRNAWETIKGIFNWLKDLLSGELHFPHIKIPHFNIDGGQLPWGIGGSGYPPSISVSWYAKGGIATKASLAGIGEAGDEGIIPLQGARMKPFALAISDNINKFGAENVSQSDREMLEANLAQSALLREQNNLLRQILAKDNSISIDGREIINSINRQQRVQGRQLIGAY